jgi:hypothetical protein
MKLLAALMALIFSISSFAYTGSLKERGKNGREIQFTYDEKAHAAEFVLVENGKKSIVQSFVDVENPMDILNDLSIEKNSRSKRITEGYEDVTIGLARTLDMGMIFLFPITLATYGVYSLSYLYTYPADLLSKENKAIRKYTKLIEGKKTKAKTKVFDLVLDQIYEF